MTRPEPKGPPELPPDVAAALLRILDADPDERGRQIQQLADTLAAPEDGTQAPEVHDGTQIGVYTLREQLGEGGMGVVFRAEQHEPFQRDVAIKLIKPGVHSLRVLARFEAERQALASMQHPGIAAVFDAGVTPSELGGQPYFAMELVSGLPLTRYCDARQMSVADRLELFVSVCDAVQHAHFRGILHRDLKPANVLAADVDGRSLAKVIDFGLARPVDETRTQDSRLTGEHDLLGTPAYMSPEQTVPGQPNVDTRSDVYALGCILYELLSGEPPLDFGRDAVGLREIESAIREQIPPSPSTRVTTAIDRSGIAASRGIDPDGLRRLLSRDLDWICRKAIAKEPERRYQSVGHLAADVRRHLEGAAVQAGPDSKLYLARKFAGRHRVALTGAALVFVSLVVGLVLTSWQYFRADAAAVREAQRADEAVRARGVTESVTNFLVEVLGSPSPAGGKIDVRVSEALLKAGGLAEERFAAEPQVLNEILAVVARTLRQIGKVEEALPLMRRRIRLVDAALTKTETWVSLDDAVTVRNDLAIALRQNNSLKESIEVYTEALTLAEESGLERRSAVLAMNLSVALAAVGRLPEAEKHANRAMVLHRKVFPDDLQRLGIVSSRHGMLLLRRGDVPAAVKALEESVQMFRKAYGDKPHVFVASALVRLCQAVRRIDKERALAVGKEALEAAEGAYGSDHPNLLTYLGNVAIISEANGKNDAALAYVRRGVAIAEKHLEPDDTRRRQMEGDEAKILYRTGQLEAAEPALRQHVEHLEKQHTPHHSRTVLNRSLWGQCLAKLGRTEEAAAQLRRSFADAKPESVPTADRALVAKRALEFFQSQKQPEEIAAWEARLKELRRTKR